MTEENTCPNCEGLQKLINSLRNDLQQQRAATYENYRLLKQLTTNRHDRPT